MTLEEDIKVDEAFKKSFNLGYRVAAELNLKAPMLQSQEKIMPTNPMHLGMQQFIDEAKLSKNKRQEVLKDQNHKKRKGKSKGMGPSL